MPLIHIAAPVDVFLEAQLTSMPCMKVGVLLVANRIRGIREVQPPDATAHVTFASPLNKVNIKPVFAGCFAACFSRAGCFARRFAR